MKKGEQTRRKIVAEAAPLFNQRGYEGSSCADLMAATGLKKGGIYRHFASKEQLAAAAFDYTWEAVWRSQQPDFDDRTDVVGWLKQAVANFVTRKMPVPGGCPIMNTAIEADDGNPVLRARAVKALRSWSRRLESAVKHGIEGGQISRGVDPKAVATVIIATLEGALMISRLERNQEALRLAQAHLNEYLDRASAAASR